MANKTEEKFKERPILYLFIYMWKLKTAELIETQSRMVATVA